MNSNLFEFIRLEFELEIEIEKGEGPNPKTQKPARPVQPPPPTQTARPTLSPAARSHTGSPAATPIPSAQLHSVAAWPNSSLRPSPVRSIRQAARTAPPRAPASLRAPQPSRSRRAAPLLTAAVQPGPHGSSFPSAAQQTRQHGRDPRPQSRRLSNLRCARQGTQPPYK